MFPWLAHGHITPYLELARRLTSVDRRAAGDNIDVTVHLVSTLVNMSAIARHQTSRIRFVELHLPMPPDLPPKLHTTKHLPACLMPALKCAARVGRTFLFQGVGLSSAEEEAKYTSMFAVCDHPDALVPERDRLLLSLARSSCFVAIKTCVDIERPYMGYLFELLDSKEIVPVGPLLVDDSVERFGEFRAEDVERAVRGAMRGEESRALRRRTAELPEVVARNDTDGAQVNALVQRMARLCGKGQQRVPGRRPRVEEVEEEVRADCDLIATIIYDYVSF
ncbi:unnamed protein product [Miscanthus lutarioriparius]|uniref:Uncharacterized protein n=1 Tax=Miscanthus lutarioriparius TaxID=422564 RepID=A0A811N4M2_9POAL|nr:unnamed protein product [Miscanthus lutarioriparius]